MDFLARSTPGTRALASPSLRKIVSPDPFGAPCQDALIDDRLDVMPVTVNVLVRRGHLGIGGAGTRPAAQSRTSTRREAQGWRQPSGWPCVDTGINESSQRHVARNATEAIKIGKPHALTPCHRR